MSKKIHTIVKATAITLALFSFGAQAVPFTPGPTGKAPADHPTEYQPWTPEMVLRAKHPVPAANATQPTSGGGFVPLVDKGGAVPLAKFPWLRQ